MTHMMVITAFIAACAPQLSSQTLFVAPIADFALETTARRATNTSRTWAGAASARR